MAKQHLLLVDDDPQSLQLMEVSLRKAGFATSTAADGRAALARLQAGRPALVIADDDMPGMDGYELCVELKTDPRYAEIPFILLTDETSVEARIRGLELGADDSLTRPIYTRELITRVRMALEREKRRSLSSQHRFFGDLADMSVVDLLQTIEIGGKSGRARISSGERKGTLWFENGAVAAAEAGRLTGEEAVYRLMTWEVGTFEMDFRGTPPTRTVEPGTQALLLEGVRRMDEWGRVAEQLPGLEQVLQVDYAELAEHLGDLGDGGADVVRLFDGRRSLRAVIDEAPLADLDALRLVSRLYFEGVLQLADPVASPPVIADDDEPDDLPTLEPAWVESDPPAPVAPVSAPPPRVTGSVPRVEPQSRAGLVDNLIRSAANLPSPRVEPGPRIEAPAEVRVPRRTPRVEPAAPPPIRPDMTPRVTADLTEPAREALEAVAPVRHPTPPDPQQAEAEARFVAAWSTARGEAAPAAPTPPVEEDLLLTKEPLSRAFWLALVLLVLVAGALGAFFLRDEVTPFPLPDNAPKLGWHTAALSKRPAVGPGAPIEGDWTLPAAGGAPALLGDPTAPAVDAPADAPADPPADAPADAPATAAPADAAPADAPAPPPVAGDAFGRLLSAGLAQHRSGKYSQAAASLAQAVKLRPGDAAARVAYADALFESGKDDAALAEARQAAKLGPAAAKAHLIMGSAYQLKGQKDAAIAAYEKYLELNPTGGYAAEVRGILRTLK